MRVGIDTVDIDRFRAALERQPRMVDRLFGEGERATLSGRADPAPGYAARFAAKESLIKALGGAPSSWSWHEIEVLVEASGAPYLELHGGMAEHAQSCGVVNTAVSLSHDGNQAIAIVIVEGAQWNRS